jgi:SPP1 family predicted phage head-tail adaptor
MRAGDLRNKIEVYEKIEIENELGEKDHEYQFVKSIFAQIIPANLTGSSKEGQANTEYAETTHKIKCRKLSLNPTIDMYFKYDGLRYDILYFQPDFKNKDFWEIMVVVKYE